MAKKPVEKLDPEPPAKYVEIVHYVGEPARICGNCQFWKRPERGYGNCSRPMSGKTRTGSKESCRHGFYPSVERFPLEKRYHGG